SRPPRSASGRTWRPSSPPPSRPGTTCSRRRGRGPASRSRSTGSPRPTASSSTRPPGATPRSPTTWPASGRSCCRAPEFRRPRRPAGPGAPGCPKRSPAPEGPGFSSLSLDRLPVLVEGGVGVLLRRLPLVAGRGLQLVHLLDGRLPLRPGVLHPRLQLPLLLAGRLLGLLLEGRELLVQGVQPRLGGGRRLVPLGRPG